MTLVNVHACVLHNVNVFFPSSFSMILFNYTIKCKSGSKETVHGGSKDAVRFSYTFGNTTSPENTKISVDI